MLMADYMVQFFSAGLHYFVENFIANGVIRLDNYLKVNFACFLEFCQLLHH